MRRKLAGVRVACGIGNTEDFAAESLHVSCKALSVDFRVKSALQPSVLCSDSGRTETGVTLLRLDTTDGEHCLACDVYQINAHSHSHDSAIWKSELPTADPGNIINKIPFLKDFIDTSL